MATGYSNTGASIETIPDANQNTSQEGRGRDLGGSIQTSLYGSRNVGTPALDQEIEDPKSCSQDFFLLKMVKAREVSQKQLVKHGDKIKFIAYLVLLLGYLAYFTYAMYYDFQGNMVLFALTVIAISICTLLLLKSLFEAKVKALWVKHFNEPFVKFWKYGKWVVIGIICVSIIIFIGVDVRHDPTRLVSAVGILVYLLICFIFSKDISRIPIRLVLSGMLLQFVFGLLILRWDVGFKLFEFIGDQMQIFINYGRAGSEFVFGHYEKHEFAFFVMPSVIFFGAIISLLYHLEILQIIIRSVGGVIHLALGCGPIEAFIAAANIFLGPNLSILTIANFLEDMTLSELHLVSTSGFATVTGSLFGAYLSFGVNPSHLVTASVMSAPAAIVVAKMLYPELDRSMMNVLKKINFTKSESKNAFDAFLRGSSESIKVVTSICANLIGFLALLSFLNATLGWFGGRIGYPDVTFQFLLSYVFYPLPLLMGVRTQDCFQVARLIGTKLFLTDIVGYKELGILINNRKTGKLPFIEERSEIIATYALCGFGNFPDVAICLGAMSSIVPSRRGDLAQVAMRAMVGGNLACFITASLAGLLYIQGST